MVRDALDGTLGPNIPCTRQQALPASLVHLASMWRLSAGIVSTQLPFGSSAWLSRFHKVPCATAGVLAFSCGGMWGAVPRVCQEQTVECHTRWHFKSILNLNRRSGRFCTVSFTPCKHVGEGRRPFKLFFPDGSNQGSPRKRVPWWELKAVALCRLFRCHI